MFKIEVDSTKKVLTVFGSGMLEKDELISFINEFKATVKKIEPKQYSLIVNAKEQKTLKQDVAGLMADVLKLYTETPFKNRFSVTLESTIAKSQINRIAKDNVSKFIMVASVEEAYRNL